MKLFYSFTQQTRHVGAALILFTTSLTAVAADLESVITEPKLVESADELRPHFGVLAGFSAPTQSGYNNAANYGLDFGFQPIIPFGLSLELSRTSSDRALESGYTETISRTKAMARWTYNLSGNIPVLKSSFVGLGMGPVFESIGDNSFTKLGIMPHAGFDIPVRPKITLGLATNLLVIPGNEANSWGANGALKYWF